MYVYNEKGVVTSEHGLQNYGLGSGLAHHGEEGEERPGTSASAASLEIVLQGGASLHKGKR